jgi:ABC-type sugar transport system substrate-binding protein
MQRRRFIALGFGALAGAGLGQADFVVAATRTIVYLTPGLDLPFWRAVSRGVEAAAKDKGFGFQALDSHNSPQDQLRNAQDAIARGVAGIVLSPTDSSTAPSILALAKRAGVPAVIADIGTNSGDYVSYIRSNNDEGAHGVGLGLAAALVAKGWDRATVGIVGISQARRNGQARTKGFLDGMKEGGFSGTLAALQQMQSYTTDETFKFTQDLLTAHPDLRGLFIQTDQPTLGALRAIKAARRTGEVLVAAFDGIPEFVDLLKAGEIVVTGMQQPYLMGTRSGEALIGALGGGTSDKEIVVPILAVTSQTIDAQLPTVRKTVFGET